MLASRRGRERGEGERERGEGEGERGGERRGWRLREEVVVDSFYLE